MNLVAKEKRKDKRLCLAISDQDYQKIVLFAAKEHRTVANMVLCLVAEGVEQREFHQRVK